MNKITNEDSYNVSSNFLDMVRAYAAGFTARTVARNLPKNELIILKDKMFKNLEVGLTDKQKEVWKKIKGMIDEEIQKGQITTMLELGKQMERYSGITFIK